VQASTTFEDFPVDFCCKLHI